MYVCMYAHICMYVCMYVRMYICMYICMYVCMYVHMYAHMYVCMYVCMQVRMHVCMYICMRACMYVCMYAILCMNSSLLYIAVFTSGVLYTVGSIFVSVPWTGGKCPKGNLFFSLFPNMTDHWLIKEWSSGLCLCQSSKTKRIIIIVNKPPNKMQNKQINLLFV